MDRSIMDAIRQQSEDLREELKDLEQWEVEMERAADARQRRMQNSDANATLEPPVRGTVPSIKQALADMAKKEGRQLPPQQDPIKLAKDRGNEYFRIGKIDEAIHAYTTGIDLDPGSSTSHILYANRSMCYLKQSAWEKAEKDASICIQMNHGYAKAYFRRALARKNLHKLKDARSDLESVLALAPSDTSASTELEVVTKMLQAERANAASGGASLKKKKIVIEEVEDEDEEDGQEPTTTTAAPSAEEEEARQKRLAAQMKEYEERRVQEELKSVAAAKKEEAAKDAKRRRNNRVEIIEEVEEEVVPTPAPTTKAAPPPSAQASSTTKTATATATTAAAAPATAAPRETSAPRPAAPLPTLDSLRCPSSFTEFERVFAQIEAHDALRNHYISLMNPFGLGELFGSNLTPEILSGFLASIRTFSGSVALQFMKGLTKVKRMEEIALFFDDGDKALVTEVLGLIKTSGASAADLKLLQSRFQPF